MASARACAKIMRGRQRGRDVRPDNTNQNTRSCGTPAPANSIRCLATVVHQPPPSSKTLTRLHLVKDRLAEEDQIDTMLNIPLFR